MVHELKGKGLNLSASTPEIPQEKVTLTFEINDTKEHLYRIIRDVKEIFNDPYSVRCVQGYQKKTGPQLKCTIEVDVLKLNEKAIKVKEAEDAEKAEKMRQEFQQREKEQREYEERKKKQIEEELQRERERKEKLEKKRQKKLKKMRQEELAQQNVVKYIDFIINDFLRLREEWNQLFKNGKTKEILEITTEYVKKAAFALTNHLNDDASNDDASDDDIIVVDLMYEIFDGSENFLAGENAASKLISLGNLIGKINERTIDDDQTNDEAMADASLPHFPSRRAGTYLLLAISIFQNKYGDDIKKLFMEQLLARLICYHFFEVDKARTFIEGIFSALIASVQLIENTPVVLK
ncbi:MAG: hypothetical protein LBQ08_00615 [Holosporaceae bacterium]|nr:hypothetical protein [Holosporaceae bacterium]